jgi:hypothetical protein
MRWPPRNDIKAKLNARKNNPGMIYRLRPEAKGDIQAHDYHTCTNAGSQHHLGIELDSGIIGLEVSHQAC